MSRLLDNTTEDHLVCSALTGPGYGRIWDASVVEYLMEAIDGTAWRVPPALPLGDSQNAGLCASDRDMFDFMVGGRHRGRKRQARTGGILLELRDGFGDVRTDHVSL